MKLKKIPISIYICLLIVAALLAIDLVTKTIAFNNFEMYKDYTAIPPLFKIFLLENDGSAFGLFSGNIVFLMIVAVIAIILFGYLFKDVNLKTRPMYSICLSLIVAGTLGNFVDRIFNHGLVRDFLTFDFFQFPSFNFADMCLCVGVFLFIFEIIFGETGKRWK